MYWKRTWELILKQYKTALETFSGVYRRFEVKYNKEILVVDDYAHHPTETSATLPELELAGIEG